MSLYFYYYYNFYYLFICIIYFESELTDLFYFKTQNMRIFSNKISIGTYDIIINELKRNTYLQFV